MKKYLILLLLFINFSFTAFAKTHFKLGMALEPPHLDPSAGAAGAIDEIVYNNLFEGLANAVKEKFIKRSNSIRYFFIR